MFKGYSLDLKAAHFNIAHYLLNRNISLYTKFNIVKDKAEIKKCKKFRYQYEKAGLNYLLGITTTNNVEEMDKNYGMLLTGTSKVLIPLSFPKKYLPVFKNYIKYYTIEYVKYDKYEKLEDVVFKEMKLCGYEEYKTCSFEQITNDILNKVITYMKELETIKDNGERDAYKKKHLVNILQKAGTIFSKCIVNRVSMGIKNITLPIQSYKEEDNIMIDLCEVLYEIKFKPYEGFDAHIEKDSIVIRKDEKFNKKFDIAKIGLEIPFDLEISNPITIDKILEIEYIIAKRNLPGTLKLVNDFNKYEIKKPELVYLMNDNEIDIETLDKYILNEIPSKEVIIKSRFDNIVRKSFYFIDIIRDIIYDDLTSLSKLKDKIINMIEYLKKDALMRNIKYSFIEMHKVNINKINEIYNSNQHLSKGSIRSVLLELIDMSNKDMLENYDMIELIINQFIRKYITKINKLDSLSKICYIKLDKLGTTDLDEDYLNNISDYQCFHLNSITLYIYDTVTRLLTIILKKHENPENWEKFNKEKMKDLIDRYMNRKPTWETYGIIL